MPSVSKANGTRIEMGPAGTEWRGELDGYLTSVVELRESGDLTELLKGLPGDVCPSPHWGHVTAGRMWFRFPDREESFEAGAAFYVPPGHTSGADAGSEFEVFSPAEVMLEVEAHMQRKMQEGGSNSG